MSKLPTLEEVVKLLNKGVSQSEIAQRYSVSRQAVFKMINKAYASGEIVLVKNQIYFKASLLF